MSRFTTARSARKPAARKVAPPKTTRRYGVEALEARELMAGNVNVTLSSGNLTVTGDAQGNGVQIRQISSNQFAVVGLKQAGANTSINGAGFKVFSGVTGNVTFNMNGGNDQVHISDGQGFFASQPGLPTSFQPVKFAKNVTVNLGDGADTYAADDMTVGGKLKVDGGSGTGIDIVRLDGVTVNAVGSSGQALEIDTNGGNDQVLIDFAEFKGLVDIDTGSENDLVHLFFAEIENNSDLIIRTQAGDDKVELFDLLIADDLLVDAGGGNDTVIAVEVEALDEIDINLGLGNDLLQIFELIAADVELNGGGGTDKLEDAGGNSPLDISSIETILDVSE
ncbi:hypothetical protein ETAA8_25480 [Anatilimnocola aggregata]|uniref:Uncharacterized protein n=1 Tax=Anatilimnocola aggregata TaxID=2528021 RepID=A0A517YB39_9BACT|nr:hypothetical protein [Anatilimnocola aggregata]QDU27460.1 hypothetical protein ETAA8_25480 [Anatilimnocola aggregata]